MNVLRICTLCGRTAKLLFIAGVGALAFGCVKTSLVRVPSQAQGELWVVARSASLVPPQASRPQAGAGERRSKAEESQPGTLLPLRHVDVRAGVTGYFATVDVTQQFFN